MRSLYNPAPPASARPVSTRTPAQYGPIDPARVSPLHLPALAHVAADLDGLDVPVKLVAATYLGACDDCFVYPLDALPAVATVVATDTYGFVYRSPACALHLESLTGWHLRRECTVHVEVPAADHRWFERLARETWYAVDDSLGVVVAADVLDSWTVYLHETNLPPVPLVARMGLRDGEGWEQVRARAEMLAQAVASTLAADAYEAAQDAVTVALPVVAVSEVAA